MGWLGEYTVQIPVGMNLDVTAIVEDSAGVGEVQIRMRSPSRSDWVVAPRTSGDSNTFTTSINLDIADALFGVTLGFTVEVRAWDINENFRQSEATKEGAVGAIISLIAQIISDSFQAIVDVVMSVINAIVKWIEERVNWFIENIIEPILSIINDYRESIETSMDNILSEIHWFGSSEYDTAKNSEDYETIDVHKKNVNEKTLIFGLSILGLQKYSDSILSIINKILDLIQPVLSLIDITNIIQMLVSVIGCIDIGVIEDTFSSLENIAEGALASIFEPIIKMLFDEDGLITSLIISSGDEVELESEEAIFNYISEINLGFPIDTIINVLNDILSSLSGGRVDFNNNQKIIIGILEGIILFSGFIVCVKDIAEGKQKQAEIEGYKAKHWKRLQDGHNKGILSNMKKNKALMYFGAILMAATTIITLLDVAIMFNGGFDNWIQMLLWSAGMAILAEVTLGLHIAIASPWGIIVSIIELIFGIAVNFMASV